MAEQPERRTTARPAETERNASRVPRVKGLRFMIGVFCKCRVRALRIESAVV
jgi:hypothetical protein